ncbi:uncharacterized protein LOC123544576 isoform X2 [Mercenaria mercenaria]|nr:uncharacterized protein LOC123544576 isoform X2 [Mercenaria mercenaria]
MEKFCKDVIEKCSLDYENEQLKDMTNALSQLIDRFAASVQGQGRCNIAKCGSMTEQTRITTTGIEYDYLTVVEGPTYFGHPCEHCKLEGCVQVFRDSGKKEKQNSEEVKAYFHKRLIDTIKHNCSKNNCTGCPYCTVETRSGTLRVVLTKGFDISVSDTKLKFHWMPRTTDFEGMRMCHIEEEKLYECKIIHYRVSDKRLCYINPSERENDDEMFSPENPDKEGFPLKSDRVPIEAGLEIEVDFHPVLQLDPGIQRANFNFEYPQKCFLFPKSAKDKCGGWKISFYDTELQALQGTSVTHRHAYMVLKFVLEQLKGGVTGYISSYYLKTGILHHINECGKAHSVSQCVIDVLEYLSRCFEAQNLPNFVSDRNIIETNEHFSIPQWPTFAKCHCESLAYVLQVVSETLRADEHGDIETLVNRFRMIRDFLSDIAAVECDDVENFKFEFEKRMCSVKK